MHTFTRVASLATMWLFIFACSEGTSTSTTGAGASTGSTGSGGTGGDATRSSFDKFCSSVATPLCGAYLSCCDPKPIWLLSGQDDATNLKNCEQYIFDALSLPLCRIGAKADMAAHLRDGLLVLDQAQFDTCLDLLKSMAVSGAACVEAPMHVLVTTCMSALRGQVALGDACPYPKDPYGWLAVESATVCKDGRCEYGKCIPFLKPGDACDLKVDQEIFYSNPAPTLCNFLKKEVCWNDPGTGGAGGGGGAGGATVMGTCRLQGELGDACDPANVHECKSYHCDAMGKSVLPGPKPHACQVY
jgi:hypothetical protein